MEADLKVLSSLLSLAGFGTILQAPLRIHRMVELLSFPLSFLLCKLSCAIFGSCPDAGMTLYPHVRSSFLHAVVLTERCGPALGLPP